MEEVGVVRLIFSNIIRTISDSNLINKFTLIVFLFLVGVIESRADMYDIIYCKYNTGTSYPSDKCIGDQKQISLSEFCLDQHTKPNLAQYVIDKHCSDDVTNPIYSNAKDERICEMIIRKDGSIDHKKEKAKQEALNRNLSLENCKILTGRYTKEEKAYFEKELKLAQKKERIDQFKSDCAELGFTDGTEGMGNCVLKLMELEKNSEPQLVITNESPSNDNAMLEIERAKLKAEQERLEVEKQRAWIERQEQLNRIGTQSIDQGWCLMNGGGWGC